MTDDLDRLRLLHAVSRTGSIAAAAREAGFTASAVSQQLAALERRVGVDLLERSNRGVTMTPAGASLSARAATLLDGLDAGVAEAVLVAGARPSSPVRVAAFPTAVTALLLPALLGAADLPPVTIVHLEPEPAVTALLDRSVDMAVAHSYDLEPDPLPAGLEVDLLTEDRLQLVLPSTLGAATIAELSEVGWVLAPASTRLGRIVRGLCHRAGVEPRVLAETDDHRLAFTIAAAVGAATVQPALATADLLPDSGLAVGAHPLDVTRRLILLRRHLRRPDPASARIADALSAYSRRG